MEFAGIALIPLVMGISEVIKKVGFNQKFLPIVNLILGLGAGIVFLNPGDIKAGVIQGLFIGLSASGLYSGVKNVAEELKV
jgi:uncharacterized membrane protein